VGLLDRLLGRTPAPDAIDVRTQTIRATLYVGDETLEVVGESHYQDALWRIVGGVREEHVRHEIHAVLMPEPDNVSVFVLWHNRVPAWASRSTGGPALNSLRAAASTRRSRGVRARVLSDRRRVVSLKLDPSYTKATAVVVDRQRVQPSDRKGRPLGRVVVLNERATYELRRIGSSARFVVWRVVLRR
jgi:hypothetical protein